MVFTDLWVKGNKRKAEERMVELRRQYTALELTGEEGYHLSFTESLSVWLAGTKAQLARSSYKSNETMIYKTIVPYFDALDLRLCSIHPAYLEEIYRELLTHGLSPNTVLRYHATIHKALQDACRNVWRDKVKREPYYRTLPLAAPIRCMLSEYVTKIYGNK